MLDFEQKLAVFASFPELTRKDVSLGRVNFQYEESGYDKKNVGYHLHKNGNGYVYAGRIPGAETDDKGFVNIREASEEELRRWIRASIESLSALPAERPAREAAGGAPDARGSRWKGPEGQTLLLKFEDDLWYIFAGNNLEMACETYEEAEEYMREEGFVRA